MPSRSSRARRLASGLAAADRTSVQRVVGKPSRGRGEGSTTEQSYPAAGGDRSKGSLPGCGDADRQAPGAPGPGGSVEASGHAPAAVLAASGAVEVVGAEDVPVALDDDAAAARAAGGLPA